MTAHAANVRPIHHADKAIGILTILVVTSIYFLMSEETFPFEKPAYTDPS